MENRAQAPSQSQCRPTSALQKNFGHTIGALQLKSVVAFDEGRFGLKTWFRRRWCPKGVRPPWVVDDRYEWCWLYAAVEPTTGIGIFLLLPEVTADCLEIFLQHLRRELGDGRVGVVLDGSGSHRSSQLIWPQDLFPLSLPAYSPELNPTEQIFRHLRKRLSNRLFVDLEALQTALVEELQVFWTSPTVLLSLTSYPWWIQATQAITTSFL
jgi:transposase